MAPVTQIAVIPLVAGAEIDNPSSPAGQVWQYTMDTAIAVAGIQRVYWGRQVENPSVVDLLIGSPFSRQSSRTTKLMISLLDWDSLQAHKDYVASPENGPFAKHLMSIVDGKISKIHANFSPYPPAAAISRAPVTERLTLYFPADISESETKSFEDNVKKFLKIVEDKAGDGFIAASSGWVLEEVDHESVKGKAKAITGVIGWTSVEAHMAFREQPAFKENIWLLKDGVKGAEVHHVKFEERV